MLDDIEANMKCSASIDGAGRLVLTDWLSGTAGTLTVTGVRSTVNGSASGTNGAIFGTTAFDTVAADTEDGSQQGDIVTTSQGPEALSTTQYANSSTTIFQDQDGFASGFLQSVSTDVDGVITGHYSNGQVLQKAQVALASFSNLGGLSKQGGNIFKETTESGAPVTGTPGTNGLGSIAPNALEQSNVDLGTEFVKLITVQRGFQANSKIITTVDDMLNELINIKR
jgi:flagellar hook protein FlgE